jgi:hypothetical protein
LTLPTRPTTRAVSSSRSHLTNALQGSAVALAGYLILSVVLLGRTWFGGQLGHRLVGGGGDPLGFIWFLGWLPHALEAGHSPFFTSALMAPQGANLLNSTAIALPSFLLWPLTATLGPVASYNTLATLAVGSSAAAAYFALLRITPHRSSAWVGGLVYGFGGYMTGQATAHVNLMIVVFPPIAAMLIDDIRRRRGPVKTGLLLGLCAAAQIFIDEEVLATTAIMAVLALAIGAWANPPARETVLRYTRALAAAAIAFAVLAGPGLAYQFLGPQHVTGVIVSSGRYVNDLEGFFVPNSVQWLSTAGSRHLTGGFSGYDGEFGSYLGVPLICLLIWAVWRLRRRALPACVLLICAAILSLGPHLRVGGHDTGVFLPWIVPNHLPLLQNAVPDRFNLFIWLAAALLLVLLIDDLRVRPLLGRPALGMMVCAIALVPILPNLAPSEVVGVPPVIGSAVAFRQLLPTARTVLITPAANGQFAMYAQAQADYAYSVPEGGVFVPSAHGASYGMRQGPLLYALAALGGHVSTQAGRTQTDVECLKQLLRATMLNETCRTHYLDALRALKTDAVIVSDHGSPSERANYRWFFRALLGPGIAAKGARVFVVRDGRGRIYAGDPCLRTPMPSTSRSCLKG